VFICKDVVEDIEYVFKRALDIFEEEALIEIDYFLFHVRFLGYENAIHLYAQQAEQRGEIYDYGLCIKNYYPRQRTSRAMGLHQQITKSFERVTSNR